MSNQSRREVLRRQQEAQARSKRLNRIVMVGSIIVATVVVVIFGVVLFNSWQGSGTATTRPPNATAGDEGIVVNPGKAAAGAPVVQVFLDYQCPFCRDLEKLHGKSLTDMAAKGEITLEYRTMNFLDAKLLNDASTRAAVAAACADTVGAYSAYHDQVFANQPETEGVGYTAEQLRVTFPAAVGINGDNLTKFQQCYDTRAMAGFVRTTNELANKAGVTSTPTLRVNGRAIDMNVAFSANDEAFRTLILG